MTSAQDPFYAVKGEIQESIDTLQVTFHQWKQTPSYTGELVHLTRELLTSCENIKWQVDKLEKAIADSSRDPAWYGLDHVELEKSQRWTATAHNQVDTVKRIVEAGKEKRNLLSSDVKGVHKELMQIPDGNTSHAEGSNQYKKDYCDFITSESDQQVLLIKRQNEELDELSASVQRIGDMGLTIHDELIGQEMIFDELGKEMDITSSRLDFVKRKVAMVMKKTGVKCQTMMIAFLIVLFILLFVLVCFT
ncbi:syntaxin-61-like isoform X1 [Zingiber officinale]|uniref:t-SNARE coiled-coil homology domain-containing protein n=1 Tax=Zingiber officinale TaxID=94328 RepID=A0A8J5F3K2_ZINOF|nr:syntaxin-61-like isoform X1 [Zingiber officinale]KAG6478591.1 hypothetical protein ZIOFF_062034 [Zingiber officinale]